ncbi:helix-turn-helix transcriptional regulator [Vulcanisaeta thermophila]|uniref:helix-turn-helix transcriptional regulator n=1 Tax=Vulcanisaeta thermophila TaxID=867917 RepID=UPI000852F55A|nr:helix-turn-helix domain-containing protein [Vulcanisaeta thermophila]
MSLIPLIIWVLTIFQNGSSIISLNTTYTGSFMTVALPTEPQSIPLVYVNGTLTPVLLNGTNVIIPVFGHASIYMLYVPRPLVSNGFVTLDIINNSTLEIEIPYNYVLIYNITLSLINFTESNGQLTLLASGPGLITYTLAPTKPITVTKPPPTPSYPSGFIIIAVIVVVVVAALGVVYMRLGRRRVSGPPPLSDYEVAVINYLRSVGGAYEVDIARQLGIPRTTVWRIIKRLEDAGVVEVRKVRGRNYVVLRRG